MPQNKPSSNGKKCLEFLGTVNRELLITVLGKENIRTIAVILANCSALLRAKILASLPAVIQKQVISAMKNINNISADIVAEMAQELKEKLSLAQMRKPSGKTTITPGKLPVNNGREALSEKINYGGPEVAAAMLKYASPEVKKNISENSPELFTKLKNLLFTFDDFIKCQHKTLQVVFSQISPDDIVPALKVATPALRNKILENLSSRKSAFVEDELGRQQRLSIKDIENAQEKIINIAHELQGKGLIILDPDSEVI